MSFAVYLDPAKKTTLSEAPHGVKPDVAYYRLTDCDEAQMRPCFAADKIRARFTIVEIHPAQLDDVPLDIDRLSFVLKKSAFTDLSGLKNRLQYRQCDITYHWDKRLSVDYYRRMCEYWIQTGVQHFSFYDLADFEKWQRLRDALAARGFYFYDRYHACRPGYESPYQKHIARYGDLYAIGGWSRVTEDGVTRTRSATQKSWRPLSPQEQFDEKMLFALADRDGVSLDLLNGHIGQAGLQAAVAAGLARVESTRLQPTDQGLWDTVALMSALQLTDEREAGLSDQVR